MPSSGIHDTGSSSPQGFDAPTRIAILRTHSAVDARVLAMVVDSANGIGSVLDTARFVFMNTDTVVHLLGASGSYRGPLAGSKLAAAHQVWDEVVTLRADGPTTPA